MTEARGGGGPGGTFFAILVLILVATMGSLVYHRLGLRNRAAAPVHTEPAARDAAAQPAVTSAPEPETVTLDPNVYQVPLRPPAFDRASGESPAFAAKGIVEPGTSRSETLVMPELARVTVRIQSEGLRYEFRSPRGTTIVPGETKNHGGYTEVAGPQGLAGFTLDHPDPGKWTVAIEVDADAGQTPYSIGLETEGTADEVARLETLVGGADPKVPALARPGDPVFVRVLLESGGRAVADVDWDVQVLTPGGGRIAIPVHDDGQHADGAAGDGVFVGAFATRGPDGFYRVRAAGRSPSGAERVANGTIEMESRNDLLIADDIAVTPAQPKVGEPVTLTVTVKNDGTIDDHGVELALEVDGRKISSQKLDLAAGESKLVSTGWTPADTGSHAVNLTIAPWLEPSGSDFANNVRKTTVTAR